MIRHKFKLFQDYKYMKNRITLFTECLTLCEV